MCSVNDCCNLITIPLHRLHRSKCIQLLLGVVFFSHLSSSLQKSFSKTLSFSLYINQSVDVKSYLSIHIYHVVQVDVGR